LPVRTNQQPAWLSKSLIRPAISRQNEEIGQSNRRQDGNDSRNNKQFDEGEASLTVERFRCPSTTEKDTQSFSVSRIHCRDVPYPP
jgi:hypothetical protein